MKLTVDNAEGIYDVKYVYRKELHRCAGKCSAGAEEIVGALQVLPYLADDFDSNFPLSDHIQHNLTIMHIGEMLSFAENIH